MFSEVVCFGCVIAGVGPPEDARGFKGLKFCCKGLFQFEVD